MADTPLVTTPAVQYGPPPPVTPLPSGSSPDNQFIPLNQGSNPLLSSAPASQPGVVTAPPAAPKAPQAPTTGLVQPGNFPTEPAPTPPNTVNIYTGLRASEHVQDTLDKLNANREEQANIDAELQKFRMTEPSGEAEGFATARMSEAERNVQFRKDFLVREETALQDRLTNANTYINEMMSLTDKDYQNSRQAYSDNFTKAYQQQQLYNTQADKEQNQAAAYLSSVQTMMSTSGKTWDQISPEMKATIQMEEQKAGWVPGTLENFAKSKPNANLIASVQGVDPNTGEKVLTLVYQNADGTPGMVRTISTGIQATPAEGGFGGAPGTIGNAQIDMTIPGYATKIVVGGLTQAAIDQAALQYALTGSMPSIGLGSTGQAGAKRNAIENRAAELNPGGNIQANKAEITAQSRALTQQVTYLNSVQVALRKADTGFKLLTDTFKGRVNNFSAPVANVIANAVRYNLSPGDISSFRAALAEISNDYTQVFSRGGQVTDVVRNQANNILDGKLSINDLIEVQRTLQAQGETVIGSANIQIKSIQDKLNSILQSANAGAGAGQYSAGTILKNAQGQLGRVEADGTITIIK